MKCIFFDLDGTAADTELRMAFAHLYYFFLVFKRQNVVVKYSLPYIKDQKYFFN